MNLLPSLIFRLTDSFFAICSLNKLEKNAY